MPLEISLPVMLHHIQGKAAAVGVTSTATAGGLVAQVSTGTVQTPSVIITVAFVGLVSWVMKRWPDEREKMEANHREEIRVLNEQHAVERQLLNDRNTALQERVDELQELRVKESRSQSSTDTWTGQNPVQPPKEN